MVHGRIEVSDGAQHESLELAIGDIKGGIVQAVQLVDKLGLFIQRFKVLRLSRERRAASAREVEATITGKAER